LAKITITLTDATDPAAPFVMTLTSDCERSSPLTPAEHAAQTMLAALLRSCERVEPVVLDRHGNVVAGGQA
jgi:hypothetical protein